jgi:hypothetical protein
MDGISDSLADLYGKATGTIDPLAVLDIRFKEVPRVVRKINQGSLVYRPVWHAMVKELSIRLGGKLLT